MTSPCNNTPQTTQKRLHIATINGAHGVRGLVRIRVYAQDITLIKGPLFVQEQGDTTLCVSLKNAHGASDIYLAAISGIENRDAAHNLLGTRLYIERSSLPPIQGENDFYHADLIGLEAKDSATDQHLGKIIAVSNFGASDLLEIQPKDKQSFFLPFTDTFVCDINLEKGYVMLVGWESFV